jgi:murein tripeptide amidase MpaA
MDVQTLCKSLSGLTIPIVTITDFVEDDTKAIPLESRKIIIIQGRVHPGETNSSWLVHGILKALIAKEPLARQLRGRFIFKVIPMINPDGVVYGNYRCSFLGKDMNRMFIQNYEEKADDDEWDADWEYEEEKIDQRLIPEIVSVRRLLSFCQKNADGS